MALSPLTVCIMFLIPVPLQGARIDNGIIIIIDVHTDQPTCQ